MCCVCKGETTSQHCCRNCSIIIHATCGIDIFDENGEKIEGTGATVLCPKCDAEKSQENRRSKYHTISEGILVII